MSAEPDVAVIIVHGILSNDAVFAGPMIEGLCSRLGDIQQRVHFGTIFWAHEVRDHQTEYRGQIQKLVKHNRLRRYVIEGLGDAAAYQKTNDHGHVIYFNVQNDIHKKIREFDTRNRALQQETCRLIFIAHSLGSHIVSTFIWDVNKLKQRPEAYMKAWHKPDSAAVALWKELNPETATPFRRLDTLAGLVTIGSNIPLFTFPYGSAGILPISAAPTDDDHTAYKPAFPGPALPPEVSNKARWLNFYSRRDVLGYPVKPLNRLFQQASCIEDICVESESLLSKLIPFWSCVSAHTGYWTNKTVLDRTADLIRDAAR